MFGPRFVGSKWRCRQENSFCSQIGAWTSRASPFAPDEAWPEHLICSRYAPAASAADGICGRHRRENTFQVLDNVTWTRGAHTIKFASISGAARSPNTRPTVGNGRFNFSTGFTAQPGVSPSGDSIASMLLGYPSLYEQDYLLVGRESVASRAATILPTIGA